MIKFSILKLQNSIPILSNLTLFYTDIRKFYNKFKRLTGVNKMDKKEGGLVTEMKD